ncbi:uncharacterized protein LOC136036706 [Artemia franciscana]|uniref:RING-type E3 ubiquitin transferase n=1 Tax=Artemia franciscana TaxID=6661 RepID=A0AA88IFX0_ARTSF|nr:hypothetical protein QYM36_004161 [Artemia franciscana]KAK2720167.1 hypothetical protein QYM36_004161 [Artemia franciscana]KAK2720168.1 hypothetical protein QYM36_004161 [Artemia franciscana]KAK2720169.1 hypothetical protein QYM36_004161 [Artemia franciscana]
MEADCAPVVRSNQKDQNTINQIKNFLISSCSGFSDRLFSVKYSQHIEALAVLLYYSVTTLAQRQTIGEEYTGLLQVDSTKRKLPSLTGRFLLPLLYSLSSVQKTIILKVKPWLLHNKYISSLLASVLPSLFDLLVSLHLCFFYIAGGYPDLVKRILRIRYVAIHPWMGQSPGARRIFQTLGIVKLLHIVTSTYILIKHKQTSNTESIDVNNPEAEGGNCPLCMGSRRESAAVKCGHVFCWNCILEWLKTSQECPVCREEVKASRVMPIANF